MKKLLISAAILSLSTMVMAADTRVFVPGSAIPDEIPNENVDLLLHLNVLGMFDFDVATTLTFVNAADIYCFDMSHEAAYNMGSIISGTLTAYCPDATEPLVGEYVLPVPYDWSNNPETPPVGPDLLFEPLGTCGGTAGVVEQPVEFALGRRLSEPLQPDHDHRVLLGECWYDHFEGLQPGRSGSGDTGEWQHGARRAPGYL